MSPWLYTVSGLFVGAIVGMTGVGGGSLMTPLLVLVFGVSPVTAVGTDLLYASVTKAVGSAVHGSNKTIRWSVAFFLMVGSIPASLLTIAALHWLDIPAGRSGMIVSRVLGATLLLTALTILFRTRLLALAQSGNTELSGRAQAALTVAMGVVLGALVTFTSVGAGAVGVSALILLYPRLPIASIVGIDIVHAVPLTLVAGLAHAASGTVDWSVLLHLLLGSIPGIIVGSYMAPRVNEKVLRVLLAVVLFIVGGRLLFA